MTLSLAFQTYGSMADFSLMGSRPVLYARLLMFAFGGIELIGMTAAEAENPEKVFHKPLTKLFSEFWFFTWLRWQLLCRLFHGINWTSAV